MKNLPRLFVTAAAVGAGAAAEAVVAQTKQPPPVEEQPSLAENPVLVEDYKPAGVSAQPGQHSAFARDRWER
jgi:hypothetical protein